ncbi:hypothetical protein PBY51_009106 [Eleginops maclovinus]|uniref:Uncharacterized protein n=1 Tax=Eleginops maclovinus TaxID=56733 RepID=A0AAN7WVN7_ELEMC|nr:hypothetical protein PBY51_009106 [Eleginops maclovinus]
MHQPADFIQVPVLVLCVLDPGRHAAGCLKARPPSLLSPLCSLPFPQCNLFKSDQHDLLLPSFLSSPREDYAAD